MASDKDNKGLDKKAAAAAYDEATIRGLAKLLDETGLTEIEIERGGERIRIGRAARVTQGVAAPPLPHSAPAPMVPILSNDPAKHPRPQVRRFHLPSEPFLFTIDRHGVVRDAIEGAFGLKLMHEAVDQAIAP